MTIDHVSINVAPEKLAVVRDFYLAALKPLGYSIKVSFLDGKVLGFGASAFAGPDFWLSGVEPETLLKLRAEGDNPAIPVPRPPTGYMHLAFSASNRKTVRKFYEAALAAGAKSEGAPGLRAHYFPTYYGAFVLDPEGRNIEAVCLRPGFIAEEWGILGWGAFTSVVGVAGYSLANYFGYLA